MSDDEKTSITSASVKGVMSDLLKKYESTELLPLAEPRVDLSADGKRLTMEIPTMPTMHFDVRVRPSILTIIESPFAGNVDWNTAYLRACLRDSLKRGEAPFASHGLYQGALDDNDPDERALGIAAGFAWGDVAHYAMSVRDAALEVTREMGRPDPAPLIAQVAFYVDLSTGGWSSGMREGLKRALTRGSPVFTRTLGAPWSDIASSSARLEGT